MIDDKYIYSNNRIRQLKNNWFDLLERLAAEVNLGHKIFTALINSYSAEARTYHNLEHIYNILNLIEQINKVSININILHFSAWFHDYIYVPQAQDNEFKSAVVASRILAKLNIKSVIVYAFN